MITPDGFRNPESLLTVRSTVPFPSCVSSMPNLEPKTMVTLMYSSGLRIGEVCRLRYEDVDRKHMRLHITHSKNRNDRYAILSKAALDLLTQYWFECGRPTGYLFPKQRGEDSPIDTFYLSRQIHTHEDRLGWERRLTCHSFRHYVECF